MRRNRRHRGFSRIFTTSYSLDDLRDEVRLSSAEISRDGKQIVVLASRPDYEQNRFVNQLFLVDAAEGGTRPLVFDRPNAQQPHWSPDSKRLAFIAQDKDGKQQVYVMEMRGGEARNVTKHDQNIGWFCWAPDGLALAFTAAGPSSEKEGTQKHNKAFEVTRNSYLTDAPADPIHLWIFDLKHQQARQLTSGTESVVSPFGVPFDFSPDGRSLAYVARSSPEEGFFRSLTLKSIELESGKARTLVSKPNILAIPRYSPDGKLVSYMAPRGREPLFSPFSTFTVPVSPGEPVDAVPKLDRSISGNWMPQSQTLLLKGVNLTQNAAWVQDLGGTPSQLPLGGVHIGGFERELSASDSGVITFVGSTAGQPAEVYRFEPAEGNPRKLTQFNAKLSSKRAGKVESITWECHDGFQANGVLVYPPGYKEGQKCALVLDIHGGPMWHSTEAFSLWHQILAAKGWIVFRPNYRGSDNQGQRFQQAIVNDAGDGPGRDVMAGLQRSRNVESWTKAVSPFPDGRMEDS